jgi:NAD-dependent dihydropyrimidine dehydrogenase PreA subunit
MAVRQIIEIDKSLCNGCGDCITACAEGAIALIDGKATLVGEIYCDGLGACIGHCPQGALQVIERECDPFDEAAVHQRSKQLRDARTAARPRQSPAEMPLHAPHGAPAAGRCPGSRTLSFGRVRERAGAAPSGVEHQPCLGQWPVQLHLLPPVAPFLEDAELLLAADCVAYAVGGFHERFLDGRALAIACPKLDSHQEVYLDKLTQMIDRGGIRGLSVMIMEVPCCGGLRHLAQLAVERAGRSVPVRCLRVGIRGEILGSETLSAPDERAAAG